MKYLLAFILGGLIGLWLTDPDYREPAVDYTAAVGAVQTATYKQTGAEAFVNSLQHYGEERAKACIGNLGLTSEVAIAGTLWTIYKTKRVSAKLGGVAFTVNVNTTTPIDSSISISKSFPFPNL